MKTTNKSRIPTNPEWFYFNKNKYCSWLYCFICSSSTYHDKRLYYTKNSFIQDIPLIKKLLGVTDKRTINTALKKLLDNGYIFEDGEKYYFPTNEEFKGRYFLIDKDLLYNLCVTKSTLTAQIFIYLADRLKFKEMIYNESEYLFTLKELRVALGYSPNSQNARVESAIKECLQTLKAEKYIDYDNISVLLSTNGKEIVVQNYNLKGVCKEIPRTLQEIKEEESEFSVKIFQF